MQAAQASAAEQQQRAAAAEAAHEQAAATAAQLQQDLDHMRVRLLYLTLRLGPFPFALPFFIFFSTSFSPYHTSGSDIVISEPSGPPLPVLGHRHSRLMVVICAPQAAASEGESASESLRQQLDNREASICELQSQLTASQAEAAEAAAMAGRLQQQSTEQLAVVDGLAAQLADKAAELEAASGRLEEMSAALEDVAEKRVALEAEAQQLVGELNAATEAAEAAAAAAAEELGAAQVRLHR